MGILAGLQVVKMGPSCLGKVWPHYICFGDVGGARTLPPPIRHSRAWDSQGGPGLESLGLQLRLAFTCLTLYPSPDPTSCFSGPGCHPHSSPGLQSRL